MPSDVTVVLAHGAWADGSSWSKVIGGLRAAGIRSVTAPLPLTTLADDVAALEHTLARIDGPVVLAAHAYAGAVVGSARAANVKALVYVTALAPDSGETVADVLARTPPHPAAPELTPDAAGLIWLPDEAFASAFAQHASVEELAVLRAAQRPISPACLTVPVGRPLWKDVPSWFLIAEDDRMIPIATQRFLAERMAATVVSYPVDHTPLVTAPARVIATIVRAVDTVRQQERATSPA
ncbi:alpha/beta hydrolase [Amycolatopsis rhabdoformis]|uniref:Alpha/beta hydrolase n=1 Tax=Amycolatopsis rhabdoformis TaxID=1448059 RepID=A0ABZ1IH07_9PSEU|nr:alpha/beta hydrolase [Amycolatopsis rhabdoformis]WSE33041.1 alpha/beta hydrolase [Amycolatopsis rhabdoformis]